MNLSATRPVINKLSTSPRVRSGIVYGGIIIAALIAFETFNFSTTAFALRDLLGDLKFAGIPWSTFLALAFCGIDFAGIARLITPENRSTEIKESWYLFGAWLLAATANAALTWWGVAVAISSHVLQSSSVISSNTLIYIVPIFIAVLVWVIRILIIASLTTAMERLTGTKAASGAHSSHTEVSTGYTSPIRRPQPVSAQPLNLTRNPRPAVQPKMEPTYHDLFATRNFASDEAQKNHTKSM